MTCSRVHDLCYFCVTPILETLLPSFLFSCSWRHGLFVVFWSKFCCIPHCSCSYCIPCHLIFLCLISVILLELWKVLNVHWKLHVTLAVRSVCLDLPSEHQHVQIGCHPFSVEDTDLVFEISVEVVDVRNNTFYIYPQLICSICRHNLRMSKMLNWRGNWGDRRKC